jgi:prepilin-type N-terminal cleavage/methylation domain-containing protein
MHRRNRSRRRSERGFNLVEVLVAIAITGVVIVTVSTLFYLGRQNVYGGKQMTSAVAVATRISEDLSTMQKAQVYTQFNLSGESLTSNSVYGTSYANSIIRTTTTAADLDPAVNDVGGYLSSWYDLMKTNFNTPKITIVFMPRLDTVAPATDTGATPQSTLLQIRAVLEWNEGLRHRFLIVDAVKTQRT